MQKLAFVLLLGLGLVACAAQDPSAADNPAGVEVAIDRPLTLEDDVRVLEDEGALRDVLLREDGRLRFVFEPGEVPALAEGTVLVGSVGEGFMGRVESATADGDDALLVDLTPVGLDEVVADGAFRVSLAPDGEAFEAVNDVGRSTSPLGRSFDLVPTTLLDGSVFCEGVGAIDVSFEPTFETRGLETELIFERRGLLGVQRAGVEVSGGATVTLTVTTRGELDARCVADIIEAINTQFGTRIGAREWSVRFRVGPLPLRARLRVNPIFTANASMTVEPSEVVAAFQASADLTVAAVYERGSGIGVDTDLDRRSAFGMDQSEGGYVAGEINANAGFYVEAEVSGLELPSAGAELDAGASFRSDDLACTYGWEAFVAGRAWLRGPLGVDLGFFSRTFATLDESVGFRREAAGAGDVPLPYCDPDADDGPLLPTPGTGGGDGGDGGGVPGIPGGPGGDTGGDPCSGLTTCDECNGRAGCGFCGATGACIRDRDQAAECPDEQDWFGSRSSCIDCSGYTDCGSCNTDGFCGWCASTGTCLNAASGRPIACEPINWSTAVASCGG
ncbi:MAG: hypothetical protein AAF447_13510 [Myxococcota bacterium]